MANATEIRTALHSRINHLSEAQLTELRHILDEKFPEGKNKADSPLKARPIGLRKGSLKYMAKDFDAPLDCFQDYMPDDLSA